MVDWRTTSTLTIYILGVYVISISISILYLYIILCILCIGLWRVYLLPITRYERNVRFVCSAAAPLTELFGEYGGGGSGGMAHHHHHQESVEEMTLADTATAATAAATAQDAGHDLALLIEGGAAAERVVGRGADADAAASTAPSMVVVGEGGSSGRSTTMIMSGGHVTEWSATGLIGHSLADNWKGVAIDGGMAGETADSFGEADNAFAAGRTISRLVEMASVEYLDGQRAKWSALQGTGVHKMQRS